MMKVTKIFHFCAGHMLPRHLGKCKNIHGHNYKLEVTLESHLFDDMVMDYGDIKKLVDPIVEKLDHSFIISGQEPLWLQQGLIASDMKIYNMSERSTTENIMSDIYYKIIGAIYEKDSVSAEDYTVHLKLWESESSYAELTGEQLLENEIDPADFFLSESSYAELTGEQGSNFNER